MLKTSAIPSPSQANQRLEARAGKPDGGGIKSKHEKEELL